MLSAPRVQNDWGQSFYDRLGASSLVWWVRTAVE